ncbi:hypothetical protein MGA5115_03331 [Marinomonas gallaica]|uniref:Uncharacterized protein n=1 Tax=Marinomonas gallaica TaxID=1806667 RepID=A0A1C3JVP9_9GAMM|nr:hypothetical protein [Marinomonas gallaica]SBT19169.1 hypothetical protein MGA5115_03331 [Marinomonas gallaica]SBT20858.1 hypothetical protein MGA5116_01445 [Marinomonas gallaica]
MSDFQRMTKEELHTILNETEQQIHDIRSELELRDNDQQHEEVESIELGEEWSPVKWHQVRTFFQMVLEELRK